MSDPIHKSDDSRALLPVTAWTQIRRAQALPASQRRESLGAFLRKYWKPIYAYFRSKRESRHDAEELVQGFLLDFVENEKILRVDQRAGRFRTWLRTCLDNFLIDQKRYATAGKRNPAEGIVSFEQLTASDGKPFEPADKSNPDVALNDVWRRNLLEQALSEVAVVCENTNRQAYYQVFVGYYCDASERKMTWKDVAERHGLTNWKEAARMADWVKERLGQAIRRQVALYAESDEEIEEEIQGLYG